MLAFLFLFLFRMLFFLFMFFSSFSPWLALGF